MGHRVLHFAEGFYFRHRHSGPPSLGFGRFHVFTQGLHSSLKLGGGKCCGIGLITVKGGEGLVVALVYPPAQAGPGEK